MDGDVSKSGTESTDTVKDAEAVERSGKVGGDESIAAAAINELGEVAHGENKQECDQSTITHTAVGEDKFVIYHNICYLGAAGTSKSSDEDEVRRLMSFMNEQKVSNAIQVSVSVPLVPDGDVIVYEEDNQEEISRFRVNQIRFFVRGIRNTPDAACFAFTCCHGENQDDSIFYCHAFRCDVLEAVDRIFHSFGRAFEPLKSSYSMTQNSLHTNETNKQENPIFDVTLEIREDDGKGNYNPVPREKGSFKLRSCTPKHIVVTVQQVNNGTQEFIVDRCFGLLLSPGRFVSDPDMQLLEILSWAIGSSSPDRKTYVATGQWDSNDPAFQPLNQETSKESVVFFTVAADLVIRGIQEPIRFTIATEGRIYPSTERFWMLGRKQYLTQQFGLELQRVEGQTAASAFKVVRIQSLREINKSKMNFNLSFTSFIRTPSLGEFPIDTPSREDCDDTDDDEPLQSGTGVVSKECSDEQLKSWSDILDDWQKDPNTRPQSLGPRVKEGIPDALRGEIWQRLSGCHNDEQMMQFYRNLLGKDCPNEDMIQRDIKRTFPANDKFKDAGGQELLYKISKSYSLYDEDVGYCQGISFIGAALLLKMPEEQAFCLLVKIMYNYHFRNLFKDGFDHLRLRLYQLDKLLQVKVPELWTHFLELGIESHMYASQWFLTLFTAKFPLNFVFRVIDLFLLEGFKTVFQVALSLLMAARKELLVLDFEGVLKYFRVTLPKKFRSTENINALINHAAHLRISKLKKYETEYKEKCESEIDPVVRLTQENDYLKKDMLRSEQTINSLLQSKITLEESLETLNEELKRTVASLKEADDFNQRLKEENDSVKELFQKEVQQYDEENAKKSSIILDYKKICSNLSSQLEEEQRVNRERMTFYKNNLCEQCSAFVSTAIALVSHHPNGEIRKTSPSPIESTGQNSGAECQDSVLQPLENELAKTKIALAEAECRNDDLSHQLAVTLAELEAYRNSAGSGSGGPTWSWKSLTFTKDTKKLSNSTSVDDPASLPNGPGTQRGSIH